MSGVRKRRVPWTAFRAMLGLGLLVWLGTRVEWRELARALGALDPALAAAGALILLLIRFLTAYKWHLLIRGQMSGIGLGRVLRLTFISDFLTSFLPSGVGTDATRVWLIARETPQLAAGASSVLADRIVGVGVLLLLGGVALLAAPVPIRHGGSLAAVVFACLAASAAGLFLLLELRAAARRALERLPWIGHWAGRLAGALLVALERYRRDPRLMLRVALLALAMYGLRVLMNWVFAASLGSSASLGVHAAFVPLIFALNQVPVSIDALGVRETSYVYLYGLVGMPAATALAIALLIRFAGYVLSVPGAVFYALGGPRVPAAASRRRPAGPAGPVQAAVTEEMA